MSIAAPHSGAENMGGVCLNFAHPKIALVVAVEDLKNSGASGGTHGHGRQNAPIDRRGAAYLGRRGRFGVDTPGLPEASLAGFDELGVVGSGWTRWALPLTMAKVVCSFRGDR